MEERHAGKFEQLSEAILDSVSKDDLLNATLQQKSISAGVMLDKSRVILIRDLCNRTANEGGSLKLYYGTYYGMNKKGFTA
ncbi:MAG: hypothetical protein JJE30_14540 [Desulfuromonadales bacterium]|nr:hypothetical protein [Desulfuromonadales bacterium]